MWAHSRLLCMRLKFSGHFPEKLIESEKKKFFFNFWNLIWYFELGFLSFNSYVYYLTRGFIVSTGAFNLATRAFSLVTCEFELVTHEFELVTQKIELETRRLELVPRMSKLVTHVLLFHHNNRREILENKDFLI